MGPWEHTYALLKLVLSSNASCPYIALNHIKLKSSVYICKIMMSKDSVAFKPRINLEKLKPRSSILNNV